MVDTRVVRRVFLLTVFITLIADQLSKCFAVNSLQGQPPVVFGFLEFTFTLNRGNLFGAIIGNPQLGLLTKLCMYLCLGAVARILIENFENKKTGALACGLVIGGAVGNVMDVIIYAGTPDMIRLLHCGPLSRWVFNIADIAVFCGMGRFIWEVFRTPNNTIQKN